MPESYKEDGRPAQQWYWDDWFSAFDVRLCSVGARGVWIDMLGIMYKAEIRGTLTINGRQTDSKTLAKIVGDTIANINKYLKELEDKDVFSRLEDNTIICRRMFRESGRKDQISKIRSMAGKKGAETRWQQDNKDVAKMATSSSTSSSFPSLNIYTSQFNKFWTEYPNKKEKDVAFGVFKNLKKEEQMQVVIATRNYRIQTEREKQEKRFIKHPATFLRKNRWKDYLGIAEKEETQVMDERHEKAMEERK